MDLSCVPALLRNLHTRYPTLRGQRVTDLGLRLDEFGGGDLVAILAIAGTAAHVICGDLPFEATAYFADTAELETLLAGQREPDWKLSDELTTKTEP